MDAINSGLKHTPGPWTFVPAEPKPDDYGERNMGGVRAPSGWVCDFGDGMVYYPIKGTPPNEADARLIAAAPELLAVARYAVDNPDFDSAELDRMARAAIAKATGGAA